MKKKLFVLASLLLCMPLVGCQPNMNQSTTSSDVDTSSTTSEDTSTSLPKETIDGMIDFYAINDYHGRIVTNFGKNEPGIARLATYLKIQEAKNYGNFVFLSSGDTFQDTYDSGTNQGELLAKALPMLNCEAMALGNHEFDWGIDVIKRNAEFADDTAFLGANIYHYDEINKTPTTFADDIVDQYKIIERNGVKIGLIGIIGEDQITSITSTIWDGYTFLEPTEVVKEVSDKLKGELGCDVVVVNAHASFNDLGYTFANEVTSISSATNKRFVDAVFTAHSHGFDDDIVNGVPFVQSGSHGEYISHIRLDVSDLNNIMAPIAESSFVGTNYDEDKKVKELVDSYLNDEFYLEKNKTIGTVDGATYLSKNVSGRMLAYMSYELMKDDFSDIDVVINNGGRANVNLNDGGEVTKGLIFDALPFQNKTYVATVKGADILKNTSNYPYFAPNPIKIDPNEYYNVAAIDYVLFHKNSSRVFDKFPSFTGEYLYVEERVSATLVEEFFKHKPVVTIDEISNQDGFSNIMR